MKNNKKVVISLMHRNTSILGGQEIRWGRIAKALGEETEYSVKILCTNSILKAWENYGLGVISKNIVVCQEHPNKYITWIRAQFFAWRNIPRGAILHVPGPGWLIAPAAIIARFVKGCSLITSLTTARFKPLKKVSYREYLVSLNLAKAAHVVDSLNPEIDLDGLIDPQKVSIAPCSFSDPAKYYPVENKLQKVVFAGHLQVNKGVEILIRILKEWPEKNNDVFVICGASAELEGYTKEVSDLAKGKQNVILERSHNNMAEVFRDAKVFLSLQTWDNYPSQSLIEGMLSGCNVVATAVGDTDLLVKPEWGAQLPVNASAEEYIQLIRRFLDMPGNEQKKSGENARKFILQNHTVERYIDYLKQLWNKASTISNKR